MKHEEAPQHGNGGENNMQVEEIRENESDKGKENGWLKAIRSKFNYLTSFFGDESIVLRVIIAKKLGLLVSSLFFASVLKLKYSEFGIRIPGIYEGMKPLR